jgi:hypothetical protein
MRKKSGFTIVEQAIVLVPEFENVVRKLEQQVTLRGQSKSTLNNYIRRIALFVVNFGKMPEQIDPEEINEYLAALARDPKSPSRSSFKHMVYGLRYYYRNMAVKKPVTLDGVEFLRRFTMHILPQRFVKIRRFGIYNPTFIRNHKLQFVPEEKPDIQAIIKKQKGPETMLERLERLTGVNPCLCPVCKTGSMIIVRELPRIRAPAWFLPKQSPVCN